MSVSDRAAAARRRAITRRDAAAAQSERIYRRLAAKVRGILASHAKNDQIPISALGPIKREVGAQIEAAMQAYEKLLDAGMREAISIGYSAAVAEQERRKLAYESINDQLMRLMRARFAGDGLQLSDRVWRVNALTRSIIIGHIERAVTQGWSGIEAAQRLLGVGLPLSPEIRAQLERAGLGRLANDMTSLLLQAPGNAMHNAHRLLVTEINASHNAGYVEGVRDVPGAIGVKFKLSPNHPRVDICDMLASVNEYGLGPGVYPFDAHPFPAHPMTMSYLVVKFDFEVTDADRAGKQSRSDWIRSQPEAVQDQILGKAKGAAFRAGLIPNGQIRTSWAAHRERLKAMGVNVTPFDQAATPAPIVTQLLVSAAFQLVANKRRAQAALATIDGVHSDGTLPAIPVAAGAGRALGTYYSNGASAVAIRLRRSDLLESTLAHEVGHFIDHQALGFAGQFASDSHPILNGWRWAIMKSEAVQALHRNRVAALARKDYQDADFYSYALSIRELWARSYAQYIALRSGDVTMRQQLASTSMRELHWSDSDFAQIAHAIDVLMREKGWRL